MNGLSCRRHCLDVCNITDYFKILDHLQNSNIITNITPAIAFLDEYT